MQLSSPIGFFLAYAPGFTGGVFVACDDVNGDGVPDILTGAGAGGGPHVRAFSGVNGAQLLGIFPSARPSGAASSSPPDASFAPASARSVREAPRFGAPAMQR